MAGACDAQGGVDDVLTPTNVAGEGPQLIVGADGGVVGLSEAVLVVGPHGVQLNVLTVVGDTRSPALLSRKEAGARRVGVALTLGQWRKER